MSVVTVTLQQVLTNAGVTLEPVVSPGVIVEQMQAGPAGPPGAGVETSTIEASEALDAGDLVNIWVDAGELRVRKALAVSGRQADGYVLSAYALGADATVRARGDNTAMAGLTVGAQFLSPTVAGRSQATPPNQTGQVVQPVGFAASASRLIFTPGLPVLLSVSA